MIHHVDFHNFKALRDVSLDLERLTVLVGPNASGKTSVLEGLHYLAELQSKRPQEVLGTDEDLRALATRHDGHVMVLACSTSKHDLEFRVSPAPRGVPGKEFVVRERAPDEPATDTSALLLRLDVNRLTAPSYSEEPIPQMESDGAGLASVLAYLSSNSVGSITEIQEALRTVVPSVLEIRTPRARVTRIETEVITQGGKSFTHRGDRVYWGNSIEFDMVGAARIPAHMASEGTMLVLGLLAAIMGPSRPEVVLMDDLDRSLHPKAQADLVGLLRKLLDQHPDMQIVATSHSPYLLDHLRPEEVRLTTLRDDGSVACGRLDEHPEFDKWKESMTPGEFWSMVGEQWLVGAKSEGAGS